MSTEQGRGARERLDATLRDLGIIRPQEHAAPANAGASRRPYSLARTCLFACKLAGSAVVGATITVVLGAHFHLWSSKRAAGGAAKLPDRGRGQ